MSPTETPFWDAVDRIGEAGSPYAREAYGFVVAALGAAVTALPVERRDDPERRHLSGEELLAAVVALARRELAFPATVFREWRVTRGEDVGRIVMQLVEAGQLSARPEDTLDAFRGVDDLLAGLAEGNGASPRPGGRRAE
jgi:uncharacterized repeat protein (TIGR04138 family)